jgi:hypothetical protein
VSIWRQINLTEEEIKEKYDDQLQVEMTSPMCALIAKIFKVLSQSKVTTETITGMHTDKMVVGGMDSGNHS